MKIIYICIISLFFIACKSEQQIQLENTSKRISTSLNKYDKVPNDEDSLRYIAAQQKRMIPVNVNNFFIVNDIIGLKKT